MTKPFLGLETIAGLCVRCTGVSQGGSVHELVAPGQGGKTHGVVLGSREHMGNDEWSPSWAVPFGYGC